MIASSETTSTIAAKLAEVIGRVGYVQRDGVVQGGGRYRYTSDAALIRAVRGHISEVGLALTMDAATLEESRRETRSGHTWLTRVMLTVRITDSSSGEWMQSSIEGAGADTQDKGLAKAITSALKYWIRTTFLIETGDDPDQVASPEPIRKPSGSAVGEAAEQAIAGLAELFPSTPAREIRDRLRQLALVEAGGRPVTVVAVELAAQALRRELEEAA